MVGYGAVITVATLIAFFIAPIITIGQDALSGSGFVSIFQAFGKGLETVGNFETLCTVYLGDSSLPYAMIAQTSAFCVLSMAELFHMLGMTSLRKSFVHNFKTKNKLLWLSFVIGMLLQVGVVEIPGINAFFKCAQLDLNHWILVVILAISPLIVHEIVALVLFIKDKVKEKRA